MADWPLQYILQNLTGPPPMKIQWRNVRHSPMMDTHAHVCNVVDKYNSVYFYQRVSIASYTSADIARGGTSVCPSVCHTPVLYQNEES